MRFVLFTALFFSAFTSFAHHMKVFVVPEGNKLVGNVYFAGGGKAKGVKVKVFSPGETELAVIRTDDRGDFYYTATKRQLYRFVAESGDGHKAEYVVPAEELPASLGQLVRDEKPIDTAEKPVADRYVQADTSALSSQIGSLRRELDAHDARIRFRDILGGLGYIFGLMGIVFYFKAKKGGTTAA